MSKRIPSYLRVVGAGSPDTIPLEDEDAASISAVCEAFTSATGWRLEYLPHEPPRSEHQAPMWSAPVGPGVGTAPGLIGLYDVSSSGGRGLVDRDGAQRLARALAALSDELLRTRHALWRGEAELAAGVPVTLRCDETEHLADRLEAVLRGGAQAVGCDAAALYLLDAATTELKLRSSWGLPRRRLADVARPLKDSLADLEALLGHAVVLTDASMFRYWRSPENFGAAVCVPVSTPSMPLGTLWIFSRTEREFNDAQTNLAEMTAGRLAADLEREILRDGAVALSDYQRELAKVKAFASGLEARSAPLCEAWDIAGRSHESGAFGGASYDWFPGPGGATRLMIGAAHQTGLAGLLTAASFRAAGRAVSSESLNQTLAAMERVLWSGSAGDELASTLVMELPVDGPRIEVAIAGNARSLLFDQERCVLLSGPSRLLGTDGAPDAKSQFHELTDGSIWIGYALSGELNETMAKDLDRAIAQMVLAETATSSERWASAADNALEIALAEHPPTDRAVLAVQRRNPHRRS